MRYSVCILSLIISSWVGLSAQKKSWEWSTVRCKLSKKDSTQLIDIEHQFLATPDIKEKVVFFHGAFGAAGYDLFLSRPQAELYLSAKQLSKVHFIGYAELASRWNYSADTCLLIGFQPLIIDGRTEYGIGDTNCWVHAPLFYYQSFLDDWKMKQLHEMTLNNFATAFRASRVGDTLFRIVTFTDDSNQYLPQASYDRLALELISLMRSGGLRRSHNKEFTHWMTAYEFDLIASQWDSTNQFQDPNNPGTWIIAPIKTERPVQSLLLYEKWTPDTLCRDPFRMPVYLSYQRNLLAFGIRYSSKEVIWIPANEVRTALPDRTFNWSPYEESFRAERFQTMHIALEP